MKWIVGLGNPGARYERTRHNLGFRVVDELRRRLGAVPRGASAVMRRFDAVTEGLGLVQPQTFMNLSGEAVEELHRREGAEPSEILVVADDLYLPLGRVRLRASGGAGGHNGMRSILETLGTQDVARLRLGVGCPDHAGEYADFVLERFLEEEEPKVREVLDLAADACLAWAREGLVAAMNRFNQ